MTRNSGDQVTRSRRPDDWDQWPDSAKSNWLNTHRTGETIVQDLARELGVDVPLEDERSAKQAAIKLLLEIES